jgi:hypothetical protein
MIIGLVLTVAAVAAVIITLPIESSADREQRR